MWNYIIQGECRHLLCLGEILCSALVWNPVLTIGYQIIGKDHALKNEPSGKADELAHWASHMELYGWHCRPQFHWLSLYKSMWLIPLSVGSEDKDSGQMSSSHALCIGWQVATSSKYEMT